MVSPVLAFPSGGKGLVEFRVKFPGDVVGDVENFHFRRLARAGGQQAAGKEQRPDDFWNPIRHSRLIFYFHGTFRWTGQPPVKMVVGWCSGWVGAIVRLIQSHPLGFLDLDHAGIMHHDFHDPIAQRFDVLDDQLQPFGIRRPPALSVVLGSYYIHELYCRL